MALKIVPPRGYRAGLLAVPLVVSQLLTFGNAVADERIDISDKLILVAGGSGRTGRFVIARLKEQGLKFRSMTRSKDGAIERWGIEYSDMNWVEADVRSADRVDAIMTDVDLVICVIGSSEAEGPNSPEFVDYGGVLNLVDAALAHGVEHFILLTAIGVTDPEHPLNKVFGDALNWRYKGENYLRVSGLNYTIVRPAGLVDEPADKRGVLFLQGDDWRGLKGRIIARDDLAGIFIEALQDSAARSKTFEVVNDADATPGAWRGGFATLLSDDGGG